jgi:hypothetical protein
MSGRKGVYCTIVDPRDKGIQLPKGRFPLKPWAEPKIMPYDIKDKTHLVLIDTLAAMYCGVIWYQTEYFAVLGDQDVQQCCILSIVEIRSGVEVYKGNTPQQARALCKPIERALRTTTPKAVAKPKPSPSGSAGGDSGIPDMAKQSSGQKDVFIVSDSDHRAKSQD